MWSKDCSSTGNRETRVRFPLGVQIFSEYKLELQSLLHIYIYKYCVYANSGYLLKCDGFWHISAAIRKNVDTSCETNYSGSGQVWACPETTGPFPGISFPRNRIDGVTSGPQSPAPPRGPSAYRPPPPPLAQSWSWSPPPLAQSWSVLSADLSQIPQQAHRIPQAWWSLAEQNQLISN
jgi:hypothetical protein